MPKASRVAGAPGNFAVMHSPQPKAGNMPKTPPATETQPQEAQGAQAQAKPKEQPLTKQDLIDCMPAIADKLESRLDPKLKRMKEDLTREVQEVREGVESALNRVRTELEEKVDEGLIEIDNLKVRVEEGEKRLEERILKKLDDKMKSAQTLTTGSSTKQLREEAAYWKARQSLRICPLDQGNLLGSLREFLCGDLELDPEVLVGVPVDGIKKAVITRDKRFAKEHVITFGSVSDRDLVKSAAFKLAGKKEKSIRLEIPNHLLGGHRVLAGIAKKLRTNHQGCRTNIVLDDNDMSIALDYRTDPDGDWTRIRPQQAREALPKDDKSRGLREASVEELTNLLKSGGESRLTGANALPLGQESL